MKIDQIKNETPRNGSVLILALVMAGILLSVGMGISGIAMKEIKLTTIGNESGKAFYMADTGAECALYWDIKNPSSDSKIVFPTPLDSDTSSAAHKCFEQDIDLYLWDIQSTADSVITTFELRNGNTEPCALVSVKKTNVSGVITTTIDSRGRSSCDTNPRRVERGLKVTY